MNVEIKPGTNSLGPIRIPSSKSLCHRAILCAALSSGISKISHVDYSADIDATLNAIQELGAKVIRLEDEIIIDGVSDFHSFSHRPIDAGESGSTLRFCIPIFSLTNEEVIFKGQGRLMERPQHVYKKIFEQQRLKFEQSEDSLTICGALQAREYVVEGNISSQFITGLLMTLPLLEKDSLIKIIPPFESRSYVDLTLDMMKKFGVSAVYSDENTLLIPGNQRFKATDVEIESDYSQAAFFAVLGQINGPVCMRGLSEASLQGDKAIIDHIRSMGGSIEFTEEGLVSRPHHLKGCTIDLQNCPDLGPILMVLAAFAEGETKIIHAKRLRIKESDRIEAMETELRKLKIDISSTDDTIVIQGGSPVCGLAEIEGHNDHRIVMSCAICSTKASDSVIIKGAQAISKSYPKFFADLRSLHLEVKESA